MVKKKIQTKTVLKVTYDNNGVFTWSYSVKAKHIPDVVTMIEIAKRYLLEDYDDAVCEL